MIKLEQARDLLKRAVETQGRDFVYNPGGRGGCFYVAMTPERIAEYESRYDPRSGVLERERSLLSSKQKTGCLIGVALDLAGVTIHHDDLTGMGSVLNLYRDNLGVMSRAAAQYFLHAQEKQDTGSTWGQAYDTAEAYVESIKHNPDYSDEG